MVTMTALVVHVRMVMRIAHVLILSLSVQPSHNLHQVHLVVQEVAVEALVAQTQVVAAALVRHVVASVVIDKI